MARIDSASDPDQEYIHSDSSSHADQEYIYFSLRLLHCVGLYGVGKVLFTALQASD